MKVRKPEFTKELRREEPNKHKRPKLVKKYKSGGAPLDKNFNKDHPEIHNNEITAFNHERMTLKDLDKQRTEEVKGERANWVYVGDLWWCRKITIPTEEHQFARFRCMRDKKDLGLWKLKYTKLDAKEQIVFKDGCKGKIVDYNKYEVWILWEGKTKLELHKDLNDFEFEYYYDKLKFKRFIKDVQLDEKDIQK